MERGYLDGKVVFVTGSSRGIGKATALRAAELGATVVVHYSRGRVEAEHVFFLHQGVRRSG